MSEHGSSDELYAAAAREHGAALARVARGYEMDPEKRRDLNQEIHFQLWRSLASYDGQCSLRTWVYRVAHHVGASHVLRERRKRATLLSLEELARLPEADGHDVEAETDRRRTLGRLEELIQRLKALDRQVILLYLEDLDAAAIAETTGLSAAGVAMRVHRVKSILARRFHGRRSG